MKFGKCLDVLGVRAASGSGFRFWDWPAFQCTPKSKSPRSVMKLKTQRASALHPGLIMSPEPKTLKPRIYYVEEDEEFLTVDIMRLGSLRGTATVDFYTDPCPVPKQASLGCLIFVLAKEY